jgi:hypothetical protein
LNANGNIASPHAKVDVSREDIYWKCNFFNPCPNWERGNDIWGFIIFILKSMVFPAIWLVHRSAISAWIALQAVRFVVKSHLLSTNHIRVLTSANKPYLIIGFKQPINFKKNVIWQMSKNKTFTYVMITLDCWVPKQFFCA